MKPCGLSLMLCRFNYSKCKTTLNMAVTRIKLLWNEKNAKVMQMRLEIASLLQKGEDAIARLQVAQLTRDQNTLAAYELIRIFCQLVADRLLIIEKQRECPANTKEAIASLMFAASRCYEIPELMKVRNFFEKKYGRDFVSAADDLQPECGVNGMLIQKLSVKIPSGEVKLKIMKEIAGEYRIEWDTNKI